MMRVFVLGSLLLASCSDKLPGDTVATYRVVMALAENTCGARAVFTQDGEGYSVELREDGARGYWHVADKPAVQGTLDDAYNFKFTSSSLVASEGPDAGANGCRLVQDEVLTASLRSGDIGDAGAASDASAPRDAGTGSLGNLVGEHVLRISAYAGTDCSRALTAGGGPFEALPCVVRYALSGTRRDPF